MSITQKSLTPDEKNMITAHINSYRSLHTSPSMTINETISEFSLNWSSYLLHP
jgi:hypothetical protein